MMIAITVSLLLIRQSIRLMELSDEFNSYRAECEKIDRDAASYADSLLILTEKAVSLADDFNHQRDSIYIELEQLRRQQRNNKAK